MKHNLLLVSIVVIVLLSVFAAGKNAHAAKLSVTWTAPTVNTDGTPLTDLSSYRVEWGSCASDGVTFATYQAGLNVGAPATSTPIYPTALNPVCVRVYAINSANVMSAPTYTSFNATPQTLGTPVKK